VTGPDDAHHTDADYYGFFMTALLGLVDDAELSGYSREATESLRRARDLFMQEFHSRHPEHWRKTDPASGNAGG
jgi:hypothetical protein